MKTFTTTLGWACGITFVFIILLILFQKQQNTHAEKMMDKAIEMSKLSHDACSNTFQLKHESTGDGVKRSLKSFCAFVVTVFTKIF